MLLYCCYTPAHEVLYRKIFLPSVPEGFEVRAHPLDIEGPGDYLSGEFLRCIRAKLDLVIESVSANLGHTIVWSDVDIRFFDVSPDKLYVKLLATASDILFQRESPRMDDVNTGFFVCNCCDSVRDFFQQVRAELEARPSENEQMVVNMLLSRKCGMENAAGARRNAEISWGYLPPNFYARTHGWPPPLRLALYHANFTKGPDAIGQKMMQFKEIEIIKSSGLPTWIWSLLKRIPRKIKRSSAANT